MEKIECEYELFELYRTKTYESGALWSMWLRGKCALNRIRHAKALIRYRALTANESKKNILRRAYARLSKMENAELRNNRKALTYV